MYREGLNLTKLNENAVVDLGSERQGRGRIVTASNVEEEGVQGGVGDEVLGTGGVLRW
jgi:hypothetical protein